MKDKKRGIRFGWNKTYGLNKGGKEIKPACGACFKPYKDL
jgi:hypothetical protein